MHLRYRLCQPKRPRERPSKYSATVFDVGAGQDGMLSFLAELARSVVRLMERVSLGCIQIRIGEVAHCCERQDPLLSKISDGFRP